MTVETTSNTVSYVGNGATTVFPFAFQIPLESDLYVFVSGVLQSSSTYTVTGIGEEAGGEVTYPVSGSPLSTSQTITITRTLPLTQTMDLTNQDGFYPETVEDGMDRLEMQIQQINTANVANEQAIEDAVNLFESLINQTTNQSLFNTRSAAALATISVGVGFLITAGFSSVGDNGGTLYARDTVSTPGAFQSADGAWWKLVGSRQKLESFGVKADGLTNDTVALQDAINSGKAWLDFPAGTILVDNTGIFGVSNQIWQGQGQGVTIIQLTQDTTQEMIAFSGKSNFHLRNMTLNYNNKGATGNISALSLLNCSKFSVHRVDVENGTTIGFALGGCSRGVIEYCTIARDALLDTVNQAIVFHTSQSTDILVANNILLNWGCNSGLLSDSRFIDNVVDGYLFGGGFGQGGAGFTTDTHMIYRGNIVRNGSDQLDFLALRPHALELYCHDTIVEGNIIYSNGGSGIRQSGSNTITVGNIVHNNGLRQLIAPGEKYAGIEILYLAADTPGIRALVCGNISHTDSAAIQAYALSLVGGTGSPTAPQYLITTGNWFLGGDVPVAGTDGFEKTFIGPALEGSAVFNPPSIPDGDRVSTTISVATAALGDKVTASFSLDLQGIGLISYVSAANVVTVVFSNETGGAIDLGSGTIQVSVWKSTAAANF